MPEWQGFLFCLSRSWFWCWWLESHANLIGWIRTKTPNLTFQMTSIAIISQHPLRAPTISTVATTTATSTHGGANVGVGHNVDLELTLCSLERRRACGSSKEGSWNWTNFHFVMCIGVVGFLVFWFVLLCRMYLPLEYQFWANPKPWVSHFCL